MSGVAKAAHFQRDKSSRQYAVAVRTVLGFSGALLSIAGIALTAGGLLSTFDGSAFWMLTGLGLIVSGALIAKRNRAGAWTYTTVCAATVTWSLRNVDAGSSLPFRLMGPAVLMALLALLLPVLCDWRPRQAAIAFGVLMLATVGLGISSTAGGPLARETAAVTQFLDSQAKGVLR